MQMRLRGNEIWSFLQKMLAKGRNGSIPIRTLLLKCGCALAVSFGGIIYTFLRIRKIKPPKSKPSSNPFSGNNIHIKDDHHALQDSSFSERSSHNIINVEDRDVFLFPEFRELVRECNLAITTTDAISRVRISGASLAPIIESPKDYKCVEHEGEIRSLKNRVELLEERERSLEIQLLEYYGLKEQEAALVEMENRLRTNHVETELYELKIESLLTDNKRLEAQAADYAEVVNELEAAKAKVKVLNKKLRHEAEQNKKHILTLQEKVMKLYDQETKAVGEDAEMQLTKRKQLMVELEEIKKSNHGLKVVNSDLSQKLEYVQMIAASALDNEEVRELREENKRLKQQNDGLTKEIDGIKADRCRDMEELVYLRWTTGCLRRQLKNHQRGSSKSIDGDLSKTQESHKSEEEKAKHDVALENASKEGPSFDSDQRSSSQVSCITDSSENDELFADALPVEKKSSSTKGKVFTKLKKLLTRKGSRRPPNSSPLQRAASVDNIVGIYSRGSSFRRSFDLHGGQKSSTDGSSNSSRRTSDDGSTFTRIHSLTEEDENDWSQDAAKDETAKRAEALKNARAASFRRRSASFNCH